ncbi:MAG: DUF4019 domain-containing protein [Verrucomicrobiae bacterium]
MSDQLPHPTCPDCGIPLPPNSPQALCPSCLIRQALASRTAADGGNPVSPPLTPAEIADKFPGFEILECLGRGGMGVVYKARQKSLNRLVAIKILPPERVGEEKFAERFAREAQTLACLNHPNIVTVFDYGETGGLFYIVMEFVDGVNLRDLLRDGKLEPKQALAIIPPICDALQFAHDKGIVHRDIKPENLPSHPDEAPDLTRNRAQSPGMSSAGKGFLIGCGVLLLLVLCAMLALMLVGSSFLLWKVPAPKSDAAASSATQLTQEGWQLWQAQHWSEAIAKFDGAVKLSPTDANAWSGLGWASFNSGNNAVAEKAFQTAVKLEPNHPAALNGLGQIYLSQRKYEPAETWLLKAASQRASAAYYGLARLYLLQEKFDQAEKWAEMVVQSGQSDAAATRMLEAAKKEHLDAGLRLMIEPPAAAPASALSHPTPENVSKDQLIIQDWLALMDSGDYARSWEAASDGFHHAVTREDWVAMAEKVRRPLGTLISRRATSTQPMPSLPGMPDASYLVAKFDTSFAGKAAAIETVTLVQEKDCQWKAAGYFIK